MSGCLDWCRVSNDSRGRWAKVEYLPNGGERQMLLRKVLRDELGEQSGVKQRVARLFKTSLRNRALWVVLR